MKKTVCLLILLAAWHCPAETEAVSDEAVTKAIDRGLAWIAQGDRKSVV